MSTFTLSISTILVLLVYAGNGRTLLRRTQSPLTLPSHSMCSESPIVYHVRTLPRWAAFEGENPMLQHYETNSRLHLAVKARES